MDYHNSKQLGHKLSWQKEYDFSVSNLVTEARIHAGLTQEKLAEKAKTTQSSIAREERGATLPGHALLKRIAEAVGTTLVPPQLGFMNNKNNSKTHTEVSLGSSTNYMFAASLNPSHKGLSMFNIKTYDAESHLMN